MALLKQIIRGAEKIASESCSANHAPGVTEVLLSKALQKYSDDEVVAFLLQASSEKR